MKLAFISDIHANLPALEAVMDDIWRRNPDFVYCLGDLVNFAGWDNEVVDYIRETGIACVQGNHDEGIGHNSYSFEYTANNIQERLYGEQSISWVNKCITDNNRMYLANLPLLFHVEYKTDFDRLRITMMHGNSLSANDVLPITEQTDEKSLSDLLNKTDSDILIIGHTHIPYHKIIEVETADRKTYRHIVNVGSVGKSRLKDNRAVYCMMNIDTSKNWMESPSSFDIDFIRLPYNTEAVVTKIKELGLPDTYNNFLSESSYLYENHK